MARKVINCAPVPEIEIITAEGDSTLLRFDIMMLQELQSEVGNLGEAMRKGTAELVAFIIYAGAKNQDTTMTYEKACKMVSCMSMQDVNMIMDEFSASMGTAGNEVHMELAKKVMAQFLEKMK